MYSFEEFIEEIRNNILDYLPEEYEDFQADPFRNESVFRAVDRNCRVPVR